MRKLRVKDFGQTRMEKVGIATPTFMTPASSRYVVEIVCAGEVLFFYLFGSVNLSSVLQDGT